MSDSLPAGATHYAGAARSRPCPLYGAISFTFGK